MKNSKNIEVKDFVELIPSEEHQIELRIQEAKDLLKKEGYFVDNLWHISEVTMNYECTEEEAQKVLLEAFKNEDTYEQIWNSIKYEAECIKLKHK